ncbi:MAG TPA: hypothetical protein PLL69_12360 [Gemmatimonadales bacterium]|nr:hypothetical protein [Gemmatimonadales bacterium]
MSSPFRPRHISRKGVVTVYRSFEDTLELFTPEGERSWVPGWEPEYLFRAGGGDEIDTVFRTRHGGAETLWIVLDHDREGGTIAYSRLTPSLHLGTVTASVEGIDQRSCWVEICYELTGLTPEGNRKLAEMTPKAFASMLEQWEEWVSSRDGNP